MKLSGPHEVILRDFPFSWSKHVATCYWGTTWVWPFMNRYRMFYVQTSTLPPRMHHKLTKHGRFCEQNNQLPTKTHVELKDNSIVYENWCRESLTQFWECVYLMNFWSGTHRFFWNDFLSHMYIWNLYMYLYVRNHLWSQTTLVRSM